jgi:hypothetical protein
MTSAFHESPIKTQNIKGKPTLFRDKGCSSKAGAHLKSASKPNSANGEGRLLMKTKYPLTEKVGMPSLQSGIPWPHSDHRLMDSLQGRFNG